MRFLNAYSPAPVCTPTRGAIFTGKCPARTQLTTVFNGPAGPDDRLYDKSKYRGEHDQFFEARHRHALPGSEVIIPEALADGDYVTAFFGKWHIGECPGYYPEDRGFDVAKGYGLRQNVKRSHWMKDFAPSAANMDGADRDVYVADALTTQCVEFITANRDNPWMAVLSHYLVHSPVQPKPDKLTKYQGKTTTDQNNPGYAAMVESVDESVGRLMQTIEKLGLEQNTLVIFTSDNGGLLLRQDNFIRASWNHPLREGKGTLYEGGLRIPAIVRWPGTIEAGRISEELIISTDIFPTLAELAGVPVDYEIEGRSLVPHLLRSEALDRETLYWHYPHYHLGMPGGVIREGYYKLIEYFETGELELYNLREDLHESSNLAADLPEKAKELQKKLKSWREENRASMPTPNPEYEMKQKKSANNE